MPAAPPVAGPADRESFFAAQRRHRRAARWYGAFTLVGVLLVGVPLSALITPPMLAIGFVFAHASTVGLALWAPDTLASSGTWVADTFGPYLSDPQQRRIVLAVGVPVAMVVPGAVVQALLYARVRALLRRAGAAGLLAEIGAREPDPADPAERQLVNVVAEMGIAAGLRPPRTMIVELGADGAPATGATVVGPAPDQATLVVGRALLDRLDRYQVQAVVAYLVASAGNGDLQIATTTIAARMTTHAIQYVLESPEADAEAEANPKAVRRALLWPARGQADQRVHDLLVTLREEPGVPDTSPGPRRQRSWLSRPFYLLFGLPFLVTAPTYALCSWILWGLLMRPWQGRFLRARAAHADAAAVQLMRAVDPLAQALAEATATGRYRGDWTTDLTAFVGQEASGGGWLAARPEPGVRRWRLRRMGAAVRDGVTEPRSLPARLLARALAFPFLVAGYALGLGLVGVLMALSILVGLLTYLVVYGCVAGAIAMIPMLVELVPILLDATSGG